MNEPSTCGEGLAARSVVPAKLGELLGAQARILEAHVRALDPNDSDARMEVDAYAMLVTGHRDIADRLSGLATQMADYRTLQMAPHDEAAMADSLAHKAFERFVQVERELTTVLQQLSNEDQQMLQQMKP